MTSVYQEAIEGRLSQQGAAEQLQSASAKALGYEMAVCVCNADGALNDSERKFLSELRAALRLDPNTGADFQQTAPTIALQPVDQALPPVIRVHLWLNSVSLRLGGEFRLVGSLAPPFAWFAVKLQFPLQGESV